VRKRSLLILIEIMISACDSARAHVTWRFARHGESGPRSVGALKMSKNRTFDDTQKGPI
jgi:hypothetical protein